MAAIVRNKIQHNLTTDNYPIDDGNNSNVMR